MNPFIRAFSASLGLVALLAALPVDAQAIYKWTDANGVVHYSDQPPPESAGAERVNIKAIGRPRSEPQQVDGTAPAAAETPASDACTTARQNLVVFENNDDIRMDLDGDGTPELLSPEEREAELERTRGLISLLCR